jgi:hypothetical protein
MGRWHCPSYKKGICYTGLCFSYYHKKFPPQHLERSIWHAMSDDTDLLYEPRLVSCLVDDGGEQPGPAGRSSFKGQSNKKSKRRYLQTSGRAHRIVSRQIRLRTSRQLMVMMMMHCPAMREASVPLRVVL